jgi:hypothetical protein
VQGEPRWRPSLSPACPLPRSHGGAPAAGHNRRRLLLLSLFGRQWRISHAPTCRPLSLHLSGRRQRGALASPSHLPCAGRVVRDRVGVHGPHATSPDGVARYVCWEWGSNADTGPFRRQRRTRGRCAVGVAYPVADSLNPCLLRPPHQPCGRPLWPYTPHPPIPRTPRPPPIPRRPSEPPRSPPNPRSSNPNRRPSSTP